MKTLILIAMLGVQDIPKDKQICFRKCETHPDYVKKFDSWHDTTKYFDGIQGEGNDYWICIDENTFGEINAKNIIKAHRNIKQTKTDNNNKK